MKHICHITTSHNPKDIRIFHRECRGLVKKGYKVTIVARYNKEEESEGIRILPVRYILGRLGRKFILPRAAAVKARRLNADIYHFHDPELLPWMCLLAKHHAAKVVWDVHELYPATIREFHIKYCPPLANFAGWVFTNLELLWSKSFAGIIAVSNPIRDRYIKMGLECSTILNAVDLQQIPNSEAKRKNPFFTVVASGTTNSSRCIIQLIDAYAIVSEKHPDTTLRLLAKFESPSDERRIRRYINNKKLAGKIKISPLIPWEKLVSEELYQADIGAVLYAKSDNNFVGIPNRLFEYWACKLPVIATETPVLKDIVGSAKGGKLVNSDNPQEIAEAISYYIENPDQAKKQGKNGFKAIINQYNWKLELDKLCQIYEKILER